MRCFGKESTLGIADYLNCPFYAVVIYYIITSVDFYVDGNVLEVNQE